MKKYFPYILLTVLVFLGYGNTFLNSFHFDDIHSILQSPWIRGLDKIPQFIFSFSHRPLLILTFNVNYAISEFNVWSYHLFNILLHLGVTLLVYRLALLIGASRGTDPGSKGVPFLAALIFALHPLNTQSVTYLSSRSSVLATLFYLLTLILLFQGVLRRQTAVCQGGFQIRPDTGASVTVGWRTYCWYFLALVCLVCGALSKEIIMTFPAMAFLFHFYFISADSFGRWLNKQKMKILLVGVLLGAGILFKYLSQGGFLPTSPTSFSAASYFLTQTFVIPLYFWKMFFPINLSIDIHFPLFTDWSRFLSYGGLATLSVYVATLALVSRAQPLVGFGMAWTLITLLPESSFVPLLDVAVEHRTYLPLVGFSIFSASFSYWLIGRLRGVPGALFATWGGIVLVLLFFAAGLVDRNAVWKDELTLWADASRKAPRLIRPYNNLGEAYDKLELYDKAIAEFKATLRINPNYVFGLSNLGNIYGKKEEYKKAAAYFEKALAVKPDYAPAHYNLAKALHKLGEPEKALEHYRNAIRDNPYFEEAYYNLAYLAFDMKLYDESIRNFLHFLGGQPKHVRAHFGLGNAYLHNRQYDLALTEYQKAIAIDPAYIFPYINTATIHMQTGEIDSAIADYNKILSLQANIAGVHKNLGLIYAQYKHDPQKALFHFEESLRLEPNQPEAAILQNSITQLRQEAGPR